MDPWHDYLAIPIAPLVLLVQAAALFVPRREFRWTLGALCPLSILVMLIYVASLPTKPTEGVNIGAGVLLLWAVVSGALLLAAVLAEAVRYAHAPRFVDEE
jgi:hypothetical protein